jgi:hypothetical protein
METFFRTIIAGYSTIAISTFVFLFIAIPFYASIRYLYNLRRSIINGTDPQQYSDYIVIMDIPETLPGYLADCLFLSVLWPVFCYTIIIDSIHFDFKSIKESLKILLIRFASLGINKTLLLTHPNKNIRSAGVKK